MIAAVTRADPVDVQGSRGHAVNMLSQGPLVGLQLRAEGDMTADASRRASARATAAAAPSPSLARQPGLS